ncbi:hypothetical protein BJ322DRAFT_3349 [Thelephora terrestris]|uniref:F-box domain-containing protein n=1 Tax=Thelephora terrestris TaxID=56493 RepID=A0A9P6HNU2_9AGAM|nr:hypothetical protein BJ322DRAFT_3349 [Thelephora terrestris]
MWNNMPPELLGKIFGHLTVLDILRLKLVNRTFRDVISSDPRLQYECELAAAGFLDNPNAPGTIFDRRRSLRSCLEMKPVGKQSLSLGLTRLYYTPQRSGDVFVTYDTSRNTLHFCRPPSASGSRPTKTWSFPLNFDFQGGYFLIHFPFDLIVIADNLSGRLHLRSIANGEPHPLASHEWIDHGLDASAFLMVSVSDHTLAARIQGRLVAWNWRTGTKVLDRNDLHHGWMAFIGADCLLVADSLFMEDDTRRLVLFDMSGMEETPAAVRGVTFMYDPRYQNTQVRPVAEGAGHSDYSQAIGEDFPFYPDPSRRIFGLVFEPIGQDWIALGLFLVHSEAFIGLARKTGEGIIAWDAWEEYTIAADMHGDPRADREVGKVQVV